MKTFLKIAVVTTAAALTVALLLAQAPDSQDAKAKAKAAAKAKQIAQIYEQNARELTIFDRQGKIVKTVGARALYAQPVWSPDGTRIAVIKNDLEAENGDLWVVDAATGASTKITTSQAREQVTAPVWSPDGSQVAYMALRAGSQGIYKKLSNGEGTEELLYKLNGFGAILTDWSLDGRYLTYGSSDLGGSFLYSLPLTGERKPIEIAHSDKAMIAARLSPDSRFVAYRSNESGKNEVYIRSFNPSGGLSGEGKWQISDQGGLGMVAWRRDGKELFYLAADRGIMSVEVSTAPAFEFGKPKLLFKAPDSIPVQGTPGGLASVSRDGQRVVFSLPPDPQLRQITVLDRQGKVLSTVGEPGMYDMPSLSPDGARVAVARNDPKTGNRDIWSFDVATGKSTPITNDEAPDNAPIWSPDGKQIYYNSTRRDGNYTGIFRKAADGSGSDEMVFRYTPGAGMILTDISSDGKFATFSSGGIIFIVPLAGTDSPDRKAIEYSRGEFNYFLGRFSPDGSFMAYFSDELEAEQAEVFVRPFDAASGAAPAEGKWQVSKENAGGVIHWRGDGKEIYFMHIDVPTGDLLVMAAEVSPTPTFQAGTPKLLFRLPVTSQGSPGQWKSVSRDGQRFVFTMPVKPAATAR